MRIFAISIITRPSKGRARNHYPLLVRVSTLLRSNESRWRRRVPLPPTGRTVTNNWRGTATFSDRATVSLSNVSILRSPPPIFRDQNPGRRRRVVTSQRRFLEYCLLCDLPTYLPTYQLPDRLIVGRYLFADQWVTRPVVYSTGAHIGVVL